MENEKIKQQMLKYESILGSNACFSKDAIRFKEQNSDIRPEFSRDADRIIHTLSYSRYNDKTQVYSDVLNDHISKRMTHVQFVSRASRTIARALSLNEDLCEAIALGHDVGHTPFGHAGEKILDDISKKYLGICFAHNLNSVRIFMNLENHGLGCNLTLQVLDGIMCHNGEMVKDKYYPMEKTKEIFLKQYDECIIDEKKMKSIRPMTMEGCIVRISDIIGYIGKDIDDAVRLNMISKQDVPQIIREELGCSNAQIMNAIILDIIEQSYDKPYISMSDKMYKLIVELKEFNTQNIYMKASDNKTIEKHTDMFNKLFDCYIHALKTNNTQNDIIAIFLKDMDDNYLANTLNEQKVIDYISGMTDSFLERQFDKYCK